MNTMAKYAIISSGVVRNVVLADRAGDLASYPEVHAVPETSLVEIGWLFSDGSFSAPPPEPIEPMEAALRARQERNRLLVNLVDPLVMNSLRWGDLTEERRQEVVAYRRALLDITDQPGFPLDIVWPEKPTFM
jgi:hypothetical protein